MTIMLSTCKHSLQVLLPSLSLSFCLSLFPSLSSHLYPSLFLIVFLEALLYACFLSARERIALTFKTFHMRASCM